MATDRTHGAHPAHAPADEASLAEAGGGIEHAHPTWATYWKVALFLTVITVVEVWVYYTNFVHSRMFVPTLLTMSAIKFATVVAFYMHLKYDHRLFRALFTGPFIVAALSLIGLMFLFGKLAIRLGLLT